MKHDDSLLQVVRTLKIILLTLCGGVLMFAAFVVMQQPLGAADDWSLMVLMALGMAGVMLLMRFALPPLMVNGMLTTMAARQAQPDDEEERRKLGGLLMTKGIIGGALLEGAAFFNLVVYLQKSNSVNLGVGVLLALVVLSGIPSLHGAAQWVDDRQRELRERRSFG